MALTSQQYPIDRTKTQGMQLSNLVDQLQRFLALLENVRGKMVQTRTNPGGGNNDTALATQFGLVDAESAGDVFGQVDSVAGALGLPETNPGISTITRAGVWAALRQFVDQVG